jgi:hypothetical protein
MKHLNARRAQASHALGRHKIFLKKAKIAKCNKYRQRTTIITVVHLYYYRGSTSSIYDCKSLHDTMILICNIFDKQ